ncbi:amidohydrolase [Oceanicola sp. 22II-s10i]|uniref:M20 aminoacylase family protein n=1 Tax=Oceanicola sp. 22II-s10i TaxID=1317116 RepID=UPI000B520C15|nr:M20 aminoacylase family protein [Oceanicola sp. 22II-s10i]OWU83702.1 amidohydrolase [Oceanicola sp. 22II-s10i]
MPIKNRFAEMHEEITAWRRDFHEHPEILYEVHRTAGIVAEKLREFGCDEVVEGIGRTGVVGIIKGNTDTKGKVIGLRADMDALPMPDMSGTPYASKTPGASHACGHDGHTAMLLGAAKYLCETRRFDGTAVVIFQPAEEGGAGGRAMCQDGLMERWNVQEVYGLHNMPGHPVGSFHIRPGAIMASADEFDVVIRGVGGHAAMPNRAVDPVVAASNVVQALQTIKSRNLDPVKQLVISVTSFRTETDAYNVIPESVHLKGTIRTLDPAVRDLAEDRFKPLVSSVAEAFGAKAEIDYRRGYPVTVNHDTETDHAADAAEAIAGAVDRGTPQLMGGEDFAFMLEERPGAYIFLGIGEGRPNVHHPEYDFNDEAIPAGCSWLAEMAERRMPAA